MASAKMITPAGINIFGFHLLLRVPAMGAINP
jgi:hypothetical protein